MRKTLFFLLLFTAQALFATKLPEISPKDAISTLHQIMDAHVSCKHLSGPLIKRALEHYLEELDPTKTYLLKNEIEKWINPEDQWLQETEKNIEKGDFSVFNEIYNQMSPAIERREKLEISLKDKPLPKEASINEFKDLDWAEDALELERRILCIKSLQLEATMRLEPESRPKALQRIEKRRLSKEEDLKVHDPKEKERMILSLTLKAFASAFDAHTAYFTPIEAAQFLIQVQQRLFGIGAQLRDDLNGFTIVKIIEGGPAAKNPGLKVNDRVIAINGEPVVGLDIMDAVELIRGEEGSLVHLTVLRPTAETEEKVELDILRGEVVIKEARMESSTIPFGDGVIAHIALHAFYQDPYHSSAADLYEEIYKISQEHPIKGIILDLRLNSGGVLPQAVAVTGLFITKGIVVSIKDNHGNLEHLREIDGRIAYEGPLIVLTSKASASAAEIVAQTLQDYGRAIIVGDDHTFGKGTFQTFTLDASQNGKVNPKGEFKVTRGKYYTVSGKSPQLVGVIPDVIIPGVYSTMDIGEKHAKNPLENDSIHENFLDDLSDIPSIQRDQISWLYRYNLQPKLKTYTRHLASLKSNSEKRVKADKFYQGFLEDVTNEDLAEDKIELYTKEDPQFRETVNVMKDLILLLQ